MSAHAELIKTLRSEIKGGAALEAALEEARKNFERRKSAEWAVVRANVLEEQDIEGKQYRIRHALYHLHVNEKVSITKLGDIYGTKDRRTINRLINQAASEIESGVVRGRQNFFEFTHIMDDIWTVEVENYSDWETSDKVPYTGKIQIISNGNDFPSVDIESLPTHERFAPLHKEFAGATMDAPLIKEWLKCNSMN